MASLSSSGVLFHFAPLSFAQSPLLLLPLKEGRNEQTDKKYNHRYYTGWIRGRQTYCKGKLWWYDPTMSAMQRHSHAHPDWNTFPTALRRFNYALSHRNILCVCLCVYVLVDWWCVGGFRSTVGFKIVPVVSYCLSCFDVSGSEWLVISTPTQFGTSSPLCHSPFHFLVPD